MEYFLPKPFRNKITAIMSQWLLLACMLALPAQAVAERHVFIINSAGNQHHKLLVDNILENLKKHNINAETFEIENTININSHNDLIVSIGHKATSFIDNKKLPNPKLRVFTDSNPHIDPENKSEPHLSMTQSACQQFALARVLSPEWKKISVLFSTTNIHLTSNLSSCAKKYKLKLNPIIVDKYINIIDALNTALSDSDILLALPDLNIYNTKTIKSILLTTYRHRIPIIGFSENFVRAGALVAMHSSTEQLGKQITELIQQHFNNKNIDKHLYPSYFDVITNRNVAKSLNINIPDGKVLKEKLQRKNE